MGIIKRFNNAGHAHELTFSCYHRRRHFENRLYCTYLCRAISESRARYDFDLLAYVFMFNHVHLLIYPRSDVHDISLMLKSIKQSVGRRVIRAARLAGEARLKQFRATTGSQSFRFWQVGGGYDRNIVERNTLRYVMRYIHNNPVRAGLVARPELWEWSSYRDWAGLGQGHLTIDRESVSLL
ncbi:MAG: transposase [candidate division Zixibacteria bacterium]|nr:transposase [candidate division Zixibacteria bacterium]